MLPLASLASQFTAGFGSAAASMAVFGFLFQAAPAWRRKDERELRRLAALGGFFGLGIALGVIVLSVTLAQ